MTKILYSKKIIQTSNLLCKRFRCYHSASKTHVTDILIDPNSCLTDLSDSLNSLNFPFIWENSIILQSYLRRGDELYEEVVQHWNKAKTRCQQFYGRDDILSVVRNYIGDKTNQPLVIYGSSGQS